MKALKILFALSFVAVFSSSYVAPEKAAVPVPYVTFINDAGEERTKLLTKATLADWKDNVKAAEFRAGEKAVVISGYLVFAPKQGDAILITITDAASLTSTLQKVQSENILAAGDRIIIDNIVELETRKQLSPVVYTVK